MYLTGLVEVFGVRNASQELVSERILGSLQELVVARAELQASLVHWAVLLYGLVQLQVRP